MFCNHVNYKIINREYINTVRDLFSSGDNQTMKFKSVSIYQITKKCSDCGREFIETEREINE